MVLAPPLPNAAPPRPARVQKRTLELERKLAQQAWELDRLRALTSRAGVVNAVAAMLLTEAKAANISPEEWSSKKRRLLLCLHPDKLVARSCAEDLVKALQNQALWT